MEALDALAWPIGRLGEAMAELARLQGWQLRSPEAPVCPVGLAQDRPEALHAWLEAAAAWLGVEADLVEVPYAEVASLVYGAAPALLCLPGREKLSFLALLGRQRRRVLLLGPDLAVHRVPVEVLCKACWHAVETPLEAEVEHVLDAIGVSGRHRHRARRALLNERLSGLRLGACWVLRLPAAASFWQQLRQARLPQHLGGLLGAYAAQYLCGILSWWLLGWGVLQGRLDLAWLMAWGLLLMTVIPLRLWSTWSQGQLAFGVGGLLKARLLAGTLRLAPETPERWHVAEDQELAAYVAASHRLDRMSAWLAAFLPRGWLLVGLLGLGPALVAGRVTAVSVAISVGGMLLAYEAWRKFATALVHLAGAVLAWRQVAPLFAAATRPHVATPPAYALPPAAPMDDAHGASLLEAHDLVFRYGSRGAPVLQACSLEMRSGDRVLLEGRSGGGKSTLAALLTGLQQPESGLLLLGGLDLPTLGAAGWRQRVVAVPQFHDNHVFTGTLAFNLLMGRHWPPQPADLQAAEALCRALELGPLLDRMPAGMWQLVGETGWQLSHGERSRLYMARALLQGAPLLILDESFAALDPETLHRVHQCVLDHAPTLMVIAHP